MTTEHMLLEGIRAGVATTGSHSHHWGELRREVFHGPEAWQALKSWCADNSLECGIAFGQASRKAQVQFSKLSAQRSPAPSAVNHAA